MDQFSTPRTFQAKPSKLKKKIAFIAFIGGAVSFGLAVTHVISVANGAPYFAVGLTVMAFATRFYLMQVRKGPTAVTFDAQGITIANRASGTVIPWNELAAIRYKVWRGGHHWQFKRKGVDQTIDYYVDGLTSAEQNELRQTIASIQILGVHIQPVYDPMDAMSVGD